MAAIKRRPIEKGFFTEPLDVLEQVHLAGTRCRSCGQAFLGKLVSCESCFSSDMEDIVLSPRGKLYTYTVARGRPPGDYKGPDPFQPYAVGVVELPEGLRILSVLKGVDLDNLEIGVDLELVVEKLFDDEGGNEVISYKFRPAQTGGGRWNR